MATDWLIVREPASRKTPSEERAGAWRSFLQLGTALHHVLQPQVCLRPPFLSHPMGMWKHCSCEVCWLAHHEEDFLGGLELQSCFGPPVA